MCGRYTLTTPRQQIAAVFDALPRPDVPELFERYNLAPTQQAPTVRRNQDQDRQDQDREQRVVAMARWGLIPGWVRDPGELKTEHINARADRAARSPMFRQALRTRRCLVPATGFYEWQSRGRRAPRQPHLIRRRDGGLFAFAGLWEHWTDEQNRVIESFTILTTDASDLIKPIHDRMPVVLPREKWSTWLDAAVQDAEQLAELLVPVADEAWETLAVSEHVNSPRHDDPDCIRPLGQSSAGPRAGPQADDQPSLF